MQLTLSLTTLLATTATALVVPPPHSRAAQPFQPSHGLQKEPVALSSYSLRKTNSTIQSVSFDLSTVQGQNITCSTGAIPLLPSFIVPCAGEAPDSGYRFSLSELGGNMNATAPAVPQDPNQYALTLFHGSGREGKWARVSVPTYCHAAGMGPSDVICVQVPIGSQYVVTLRG